MLPAKILLVDRTPSLVRAWSEVFANHENVTAIEGDFFAHEADAMVSPANSFGNMDGGLDAAIRDALGGTIEGAVRRVILERHHGELHVGAAEVVETTSERWPFLVVAPTMRVPESVASTVNAYVAFRAALLAVVRHNQAGSHPHRIASLLVPGLGTGIGMMDPRRCAAQMRIALDQVSGPARIPSFASIHAIHQKLRTSV